MYIETHQVNSLGSWLAGLAAPGLTPQPLLRQALDGHLVDHVVGQVLVQVGQGVGVLGESLVLAPQSVPRSQLSEPQQIHHVQSRDVVASVAQVALPVASLPETVVRVCICNIHHQFFYITYTPSELNYISIGHFSQAMDRL